MLCLSAGSKTGHIEAVIRDRVRPNGLAFSPDEAWLYVADTGRTHVPGLPATIHAYPIQPNGLVGEPKLFSTCANGLYDGFRVIRPAISGARPEQRFIATARMAP